MVGFLYAGQGSQYPNMGADLYEKYEVFKKTYDATPKIRDMCFDLSGEELAKTENTQPVMILFEVAMTKLLAEHGILPQAVCGLSIGEYAALNAAKVITEKEALLIAQKRGEAMQEALRHFDTAMLACLGVEREDVLRLCTECSMEGGRAYAANFNCPGQIVVAGDKRTLEKMESEIKGKKLGRGKLLNVGGAFHTLYMQEAGEKLVEIFKSVNFEKAKLPIACNLTGKLADENTDFKAMMIEQVKSPVEFESCIRSMIDLGVDTFVEIGFGNVLSGFVKKISKEVKVLSCYHVDSVDETILKLKI